MIGGKEIHPGLRELLVEASLALARLDADRLEMLTLSCRALNRDLAGWSSQERAEFARQARGASPEMEVFGRVLDATRANLEVMNRVRERRCGDMKYPGCGTRWAPWWLAERGDGNH